MYSDVYEVKYVSIISNNESIVRVMDLEPMSSTNKNHRITEINKKDTNKIKLYKPFLQPQPGDSGGKRTRRNRKIKKVKKPRRKRTRRN